MWYRVDVRDVAVSRATLPAAADGPPVVARKANPARHPQVMGRAGAHQVEGAKTAVGHAYGGGSQYFAMWVVGDSL